MVDQPKRVVVLNALGYVQNQITLVNTKLLKETNPDGEYDATFVAGLDTSAKTNLVNILKMLRWLKEGYFGISGTPAAFTDAEVDAINPSIRTAYE